jgi:MFS family permease
MSEAMTPTDEAPPASDIRQRLRFRPRRHLLTREPTRFEASGRRILNRAAATVVVGGMIIAGISWAFAGQLLALDVRALGLLIGILLVGIGLVAPVEPGQRKLLFGVLIIALGIISIPVAFGGYVVGALVTIIGGAMLVAYEPPTESVKILVREADHTRRLLAFVVDFAVAFAAHRVFFFMAGWFFTSTINVVIAWIIVWFLVVVEPSILTRRTPGRLLVSIRIGEPEEGNRGPGVNTAIREGLRGLIAVASLFFVLGAALRNNLQIGLGLVALVIVILGVFVFESFDLLNRLSRTVVIHDEIVEADSASETSPAEEETSSSEEETSETTASTSTAP